MDIFGYELSIETLLTYVVIVLLTFILTTLYWRYQRVIAGNDITNLLDAIWETEAVQKFKEETWEEMKDYVAKKLYGTPVWGYFETWYNEDDEKTDEEIKKEIEEEEEKVEKLIDEIEKEAEEDILIEED